MTTTLQALSNAIPAGFTGNMLSVVGTLFSSEFGVYALTIIGTILAITALGLLIEHFRK